jgi:uncharacterized membrane protein YhhN
MPKNTKLAALGYVALAAADTYLASRGTRASRTARFVTKPLLMPVLATAFVGATEGRGRLAQGTAAAQAFSWGGDVALLGKGDTAFLAGLSSFFAGHIGYVVAFASAREKGNPIGSPGVKGAALMLATTAPVMAYAAGRKEPKLRVPVAAYSAVLASMFATSTLLDKDLPARARNTIAAGTGLFLASDTILGTREFLLKSDSPALDAAVMATYTAGQGLIALGVAQAARSAV